MLAGTICGTLIRRRLIMRDPLEVFTKRGTPVMLVVTRLLFVAYFIGGAAVLFYPPLPQSKLTLIWLVYLLLIYICVERVYGIFLRKGIDMTFAWPLILAVYMLSLVTLLLGGQEAWPTLNRAEHFTVFILVAYVVAVFFNEYLPQNVWRKHPYYTSLLILSVSALAGVMNELVELISDGLFYTTFVGPGNDTALDLLMNTLGTGLFLSVRLIVPRGFVTSLVSRSRRG